MRFVSIPPFVSDGEFDPGRFRAHMARAEAEDLAEPHAIAAVDFSRDETSGRRTCLDRGRTTARRKPYELSSDVAQVDRSAFQHLES